MEETIPVKDSTSLGTGSWDFATFSELSQVLHLSKGDHCGLLDSICEQVQE